MASATPPRPPFQFTPCKGATPFALAEPEATRGDGAGPHASGRGTRCSDKIEPAYLCCFLGSDPAGSSLRRRPMPGAPTRFAVMLPLGLGSLSSLPAWVPAPDEPGRLLKSRNGTEKCGLGFDGRLLLSLHSRLYAGGLGWPEMGLGS